MIEPRVDIVTVLWNSAVFLQALFEGLANLDYPRDRLRLHFVDNNPGDGSLEAVRHQMAHWGKRLPEIIIHEPKSNTGFAGGNNLALRRAMQDGIEYAYLLNPDAWCEPAALREAVAVAESDRLIGSVQSLIVLDQNPQEINSRGNALHYLGFGYCNGYHEKREKVQSPKPESLKSSPEVNPPLVEKVKSQIAYASGAAVLYPTRVLQEVGMFDETLWLYHEDLDLGWRIMLAGYHNLLAPKSVVRHHYEFSRSITKWYWMERNRIAVVLKNYRLLTILILLPQLMIADLALLAFAFKGGWWKEKLRASAWFFRPQTWAYLMRSRVEIARIRKVNDRRILEVMTPVIAYQEFADPLITMFVNPAWRCLFWLLKFVVVW